VTCSLERACLWHVYAMLGKLNRVGPKALRLLPEALERHGLCLG